MVFAGMADLVHHVHIFRGFSKNGIHDIKLVDYKVIYLLIYRLLYIFLIFFDERHEFKVYKVKNFYLCKNYIYSTYNQRDWIRIVEYLCGNK